MANVNSLVEKVMERLMLPDVSSHPSMGGDVSVPSFDAGSFGPPRPSFGNPLPQQPFSFEGTPGFGEAPIPSHEEVMPPGGGLTSGGGPSIDGPNRLQGWLEGRGNQRAADFVGNFGPIDQEALAYGLQGIPTTTALGSFAAGYAGGLTGKLARSQREAAAAAAAEQQAYDRSRDRISDARADREFALDVEKHELDVAEFLVEDVDAETLTRLGLTEDQHFRINTHLNSFKSGLGREFGLTEGSLNTLLGLDEEEQEEYAARYNAEWLRQVNEARALNGDEPLAKGEFDQIILEQSEGRVPEIGPSEPPEGRVSARAPWGGAEPPAPASGVTGAGTVDDPYRVAPDADIAAVTAGWVPGVTVFYDEEGRRRIFGE